MATATHLWCLHYSPPCLRERGPLISFGFLVVLGLTKTHCDFSPLSVSLTLSDLHVSCCLNLDDPSIIYQAHSTANRKWQAEVTQTLPK